MTQTKKPSAAPAKAVPVTAKSAITAPAKRESRAKPDTGDSAQVKTTMAKAAPTKTVSAAPAKAASTKPVSPAKATRTTPAKAASTKPVSPAKAAPAVPAKTAPAMAANVAPAMAERVSPPVAVARSAGAGAVAVGTPMASVATDPDVKALDAKIPPAKVPADKTAPTKAMSRSVSTKPAPMAPHGAENLLAAPVVKADRPPAAKPRREDAVATDPIEPLRRATTAMARAYGEVGARWIETMARVLDRNIAAGAAMIEARSPVDAWTVQRELAREAWVEGVLESARLGEEAVRSVMNVGSSLTEGRG